MMGRRGLLFVVPLLLIFLQVFHYSAAQECKDGCSAGLSTCESVDYNLYVTNTTDVPGTEATIQKLLYQAKALGNATCFQAMQSLLCNVLHPSCDGSTPNPIAPCVDICYNFLTNCGKYAKFFPKIIQPYLNCSGINPKTQQPLFAKTSCSFSKNSTTKCPSNPRPHVIPYTGVCAPYIPQLTVANQSAVCAPYITKKIWVANDWPNWQYFQAIANINYFAIENAKPIMPQGCYKHLQQFECGNVDFPPCIEHFVPEYNTTVGIRPQQCNHMCDDINAQCGKFFDDTELSYFKFNCSDDPKNLFSDGPYRVNITDTIYYEGECLEYMIPEDPVGPYVLIDVSCPAGTGKKTERSDDLPLCGLKCPDESYSTKEWERLVLITQIGSSLSLIAMLFLILSYLLDFEKRKFPASMRIWEFIATAGFAVAFLIGGRDPIKQTWCYDEGTNATQDNSSRCGAQGFLFIFFGLALSLWCCNIGFSMFYAIVLNKKVRFIKRYWPVFHILGWGIPLIFAIAAIASKSIGYGPPLAWCFIHFAGFGFGEGSTSRDYPLFYIPEGVLFFIILALFVATFAKIVRLESGTQFSGNTKEVKRHSRTFRAQVHLLIFIFIVGVICFSIFEWRLQIDGDDKTSATGLKWTYCKIKTILKLPNLHPCPGDVNPSRINYNHTAFESFALSGIGILIFIAFGSDPLLYRHWAKILKLAFKGEFQQIKEFVMNGVDPFPSSNNFGTTGPTQTGHSRSGNSTMSVQAVSVTPQHPMFVDSQESVTAD